MKICSHFFLLLIVLSLSFSAWAIPLDDLSQNEELLIESSELKGLPYKIMPKVDEPTSSPASKYSSEASYKQSLIQETFLNEEKGARDAPEDKLFMGGDDSEFYLFEQEELDAQKPGLGIYETLAPMLSSEMKKDTKKVWAETAGFREAIDFSTKDSESKELILKQSSKEMMMFKGKSLEEIANKNLPPGVYDDREVDKTMVKVLFDDFFELLKNAFLIIAGILLLGKIISFIIKKIISTSERRKKRRARRHSKKRHRKKRRRSFARELS